MKLHLLFSGFFLFQYLALAQSDLSIRVIDESAIPYMEFLSKAEFDQRFPGQIKTDLADLENGWYVIYTHENLNYYFGPVLLKSTGKDYQKQLTRIVEAAVAQRPDIQGYQLVLRYEPSTVPSGDSSKSDDAEGNREIGNEEQPGEASQPTGFWGFVRRIFGF